MIFTVKNLIGIRYSNTVSIRLQISKSYTLSCEYRYTRRKCLGLSDIYDLNKYIHESTNLETIMKEGYSRITYPVQQSEGPAEMR